MADKKKGRAKPGGKKPAGRRQQRKKANPKPTPEAWVKQMEECSDAESLNDNIITPFIAALEDTCAARGYVLNIYGPTSNLVISSEDDVEAIYNLVEGYFDAKEEEGDTG